MGDDDKCLSELVAEVEEELMQLRLVLTVKASRRLVSQYDRRMIDKGARHGHPLLLTARQFVRFVACAVGQSHEVEQFLGTLPCLFGGLPGNEGGNHHVLQGRELGQQLMKLKDKTHMTVAKLAEFAARQLSRIHAIDHHGATVGPVQCADNLEEGGLPRPRRSHDTHHFALGNVQVDALEHLQRAEALRYSLDVYHFFVFFFRMIFLPTAVFQRQMLR